MRARTAPADTVPAVPGSAGPLAAQAVSDGRDRQIERVTRRASVRAVPGVVASRHRALAAENQYESGAAAGAGMRA